MNSWKGYFLLTDYGVHAEPGPDRADSDTLTESFTSTCNTDEFYQQSPERTTPFSALREPGETEALRNSTPHPLQPDGNNSRAEAEAEEGWDVPDRSKEPDSNEVKETDPLVAMNSYAPPEPKPSPQQLDIKDEEITTTSESEPDKEEDRHEVAQDTGPHQRDYRKLSRQDAEERGFHMSPGAPYKHNYYICTYIISHTSCFTLVSCQKPLIMQYESFLFLFCFDDRLYR